MSDTIASLSRKIGTAGDLQSVVRTMKAGAASSITHYKRTMVALDDYYRTVQLGLTSTRVMPIDFSRGPRPRD